MSDTFKAEARFRVKTKIHCEVTLSEQSNPENVKKDILSRLWNLRGWYGLVGKVQVLVLTHNFEMRKPVVTRLPVFAICGLWFH